MEIWFYHLQRQPLERALPTLLEKARERGWRVVVQTVDDLRLKALDDLLWIYKAESFLPHGPTGDRGAEGQPILLTRGTDNPSAAQLRIFIEGAAIPPAVLEEGYERVILMFDGGNDAELAEARRQWSALKAANATLAFWQQSDAGRWERKM